MTNTDWPPPTRRHVPSPGLTEDVSPQLHRALQGWLREELLGVSAGMTPRPRIEYGSNIQRIMLRLGTDTLPWDFPPETILDAVHETLYQVQWGDPTGPVHSLDLTLSR